MPDPSITGTVPDMTVAELVREGHCSSGCASGVTDPATCSCTCDGLYHGLVGDVVITGTAHLRQPLPAPQPGPDLFEEAGLAMT